MSEQGGFNEKLDVLRLRYDSDGKFVNEIRTLVLEEIIGEDEAQGVAFNKNSKKILRPRYKNMLRAEQRNKLKEGK